MANIKGKKIIKAKLASGSTPIIANIVPNANPIKSNISKVPSATTTQKGIIRIATDEEAIKGLSTNTVITPYTLKLATTTFVYEQGLASDTWVIQHDLNKNPSITVVDSADTVISIFKTKYNDKNTVTVYFNGAFTGKAYLN